jgi:hypothetical protein
MGWRAPCTCSVSNSAGCLRLSCAVAVGPHLREARVVLQVPSDVPPRLRQVDDAPVNQLPLGRRHAAGPLLLLLLRQRVSVVVPGVCGAARLADAGMLGKHSPAAGKRICFEALLCQTPREHRGPLAGFPCSLRHLKLGRRHQPLTREPPSLRGSPSRAACRSGRVSTCGTRVQRSAARWTHLSPPCVALYFNLGSL